MWTTSVAILGPQIRARRAVRADRGCIQDRVGQTLLNSSRRSAHRAEEAK
jgi:hypothetical protein